MANFVITPNMSLIAPTPGSEPGPQYASDQNQSFVIIDGHNHGPGSGVQITPSGLNINTNLNFQNNSPSNVASILFSAAASNANLTTLYTNAQSGGGIIDLFFNDGAGNVIALTKAGLVNATIASIPGESYSGGTFTWVQGAGSTTPANFDIGGITIRPATAGTTNGVILGPPSGISSLYNIQLPVVPAVDSFMQLNTDGSMVATLPITGGLDASNFDASTQASLYQPGDFIYSGATTRAGALLCDGTSYLIATYPALAAALFDSGTGNYSYGSPDGTHFNVPDLRGSFARMVTGSSGNDPDASSRSASASGGNTGNNVGSVQNSAIQNHSHYRNQAQLNEESFIAGGSLGPTSGGSSLTPQTNGGNMFNGNISSETRPINVYVNIFIKT